MTSDERLLQIYHTGWKDCSNNISDNYRFTELEQKAYNAGWMSYIIGDEVTSVDGWSNEQILAYIKSAK